jgi:hypothetical protein
MISILAVRRNSDFAVAGSDGGQQFTPGKGVNDEMTIRRDPTPIHPHNIKGIVVIL